MSLGRNSKVSGSSVLVGALCGVVLGGLAPEAQAMDMNARVAIGAFRGPQAARVQDAVESALLRRYYLVPDSVVAEAARKSGVRLQIDQDFAEVAKSLNVQAFVSATVRKQRQWTVQMVVRKGDTGEAVGRLEWADRRIETLAAALARSTPRRLQALLTNRSAPAAAAREPEEEVAVKAPSLPERAPTRKEAGLEEEESPAAAPRPYFELSVGGRVFSRTMSYVDNYSGLPGYRLDRATAVNVEMALHPFGAVPGTSSAMAGFGLTGNLTYALGIGTQNAGGDGPARAEVFGYEVGARQRISVGMVDVLPHVSYLVDNFVASAAELSPDVRYRAVRAGLGGRLWLSSKAEVRASADYLHVLSAGPLTEDGRFPRATVRGVDLSLGAGYSVSDSLEAVVAVGLRRYGFDMGAQPGDTLVAGGAIDEYLSMTLGLAYRPTLGGR
jgi:hypothetical protein